MARLSGFHLEGGIGKTIPVGSAYLTYENKNPSSFLGGTWALYATDRYLRGGSASSKAGATGGSDTISVSQMPAHSHLYVSTGKFCWNVSGVASAPAWGDGDAKTGTTTGTTGGGTVLPIVRNRVRLEAHGVGEVPHAA